MKRLLAHIATGILVIYLANLIVPGVEIESELGGFLKILALSGIFLGLINYYLKPIVNLITLPLRILTFGLFGLVVNMLMVWIVDIAFPGLVILGITPLFWTGLLSWLLNILIVKRVD
jgi:putative membrane protein